MTRSLKTPRTEGFRMPAEWEAQEGVWLAWPHNTETFGKYLEEVQTTYLELIKVISKAQHVHLCVNDGDEKKKVQVLLKSGKIPYENILFHEIPTVDVWMRDYGPTFLISRKFPSQLAMIDWDFNAWGNKYPELKADSFIPEFIHKYIPCTRFQPKFVLEGGSIEVNGEGTLLTTEQCLLHPNRNPQLSRLEIEHILTEYLNVSKILWLQYGIAGDDTDGHIDDIARFISPITILCAYEENTHDENYLTLYENYLRLCQMTTAKGQRLSVIKLPMPKVELHGSRLPASYLNFYIGNEAVVVPIFGDPHDAPALKIFQEHFPNRKVVGIDSKALVYGLGSFHCITQQQPKSSKF
ncbi:MAG: agmatine deiminase family protein [Promethearchaeota archaeon]